MAATNELAVLFPGRKLSIPTSDPAKPLEVTVFPLGTWHLRQFSESIAEAGRQIRAILGVLPWSDLVSDDPEKAAAATEVIAGRALAALPQVAPIVLSELLPLVAECVEGINLTDKRVPAWVLPPLVDAWVEESFGSADKIRPFVALLESTWGRITGSRPDLWAKLSASSSQQGTTSATS